MQICTLKLEKRRGSPFWQVEGYYRGTRKRISTGTRNKHEAQLALAGIFSELEHESMNKKKQATFEEASEIHLKLITKKTANKDHEYSDKLMPFIGGMNLNNIGMRPKQVRDCDLHVLNQYILHRANSGVSVTTVNKELAFINLLGKKAVSEYGLIDYWTPIRLLDKDEAVFYRLKAPQKKKHLDYNWQGTLLNNLPSYLRDMALFSINTGQRDSVVCNLKWSFLNKEDDIYYFKIPKSFMKSEQHMAEDHAYVVLNDIATDLVLSKKWTTRCIDDYIFLDDNNNPVERMNCYAYQEARKRVAEQFPEIMETDIHSFKRTFVTRLIDKGVPYEWVQRMANHKLPEVTEVYNKMNPEKRKMMYEFLQKLVDKPQLKLYSMNRG